MEYIDLVLGNPEKPFSLKEPRYDQSTFYGRWRYFLDLINPVSLFYSKSRVEESKKLLEQYKSNQLPPQVSDQQLWKAKWIVESSLHPDTGEPIPKFFRLSAFGPVNIPILIGMLLSKKTPITIPLWQVVNQTYNVGFNYANRNINNPFTNTQLGVSYLLATSASVVTAVGLDKVITKYAGNSFVLRTFGPATAVAIAGCFNLLVIRYRELKDGIVVYDKEGNPLGRSTQAAWDGLTKTTGIRFTLQYPGSFFPVLMHAGLNSLRMLPAGGVPRVLAEVGIMITNMFVTLPLCFSIYPQMVYSEKLEPHLHSDSGFYYNRGL